MIEDPAKFPRAKPGAPAMSVLDRQIADAKGRLALSASDDTRRYYAERIVGLRFERGDFPMIQSLDAETRRTLVAEVLKPKEPQP